MQAIHDRVYAGINTNEKVAAEKCVCDSIGILCPFSL